MNVKSLYHRTGLEIRPWGYYHNLMEGDGLLVKHITVNPGEKISLQYHQHRSEYWVVVSGKAFVRNGAKKFHLKPNESTHILKRAVHRLENQESEPLHLIEIQNGDYIGEDDIIRLEDSYGRVP
jgi:mannose-6-phosphate isomerase-like protein (cupin superfamily)